MKVTQHIDIEKYRYNLPETSIARYPLSERDGSKLLTYTRGQIGQTSFNELSANIPPGSRLVFNNTRVIQARLKFKKATGASIEIFCLEPIDPVDYQQSFHSMGSCSWKCLVGNAKKWKSGVVTLDSSIEGVVVTLEATMLSRSADSYEIHFKWGNPQFSFGEIIEYSGSTPIPPYLNRVAEESDKDRYQTIYSQLDGSVAAPTAGLHFTEEMMKQLVSAGVKTAELTLHVGAGTFVPVKAENARDHSMHAEKVVVSLNFLEEWRNSPAKIIAVGTTSTRSLESLYWLGVKLLPGAALAPSDLGIRQWDNERLSGHIALEESLGALVDYCKKRGLDQLRFHTQLMIVPGYKFKTISGLITNFHLPGSTLLLLIGALIGDDWKKVYDYALEHQFRFLSYGDSSLLLP